MEKTNIVEVRGLNKSYGRHKVLEDVSFEIKANEIVGFIGPNGAGKSTTMKCMCSLIFPDSGEIFIDGYDLKKNRQKALSVQAALIEAPGLYDSMTGKENIDLIGKLRKIDKNRRKEIYEFTEIGDALNRKVSGYSMGMKQRLALGIAIMSKPKFLILDEPTNGLDPTGIIHLRKTLQELKVKEDRSIMFSSHQLGEVEKLADRIICINQGKIIETPKALEEKYNYRVQVESEGNFYKNLQESFPMERITELSKDIIGFELSNQTIFNDIIKHLVKNNVDILDVQKENVDVEAVYEEVYVNNRKGS
ncbi:ABC transporter ATP-binding protein [Poseidonibacter sp.]|uniref:ABC transporter ATP-binding protein n=1 Tax=Poseidonibacter sp. TaxID=2321188 RepID=UPI003C7229E8